MRELIKLLNERSYQYCDWSTILKNAFFFLTSDHYQKKKKNWDV